jgi:hypothetical protein
MPSFLSDEQIETTLSIFSRVDESALTPDLQHQLQQLRSHLLYTGGGPGLDLLLPSPTPTSTTTSSSVGFFPSVS